MPFTMIKQDQMLEHTFLCYLKFYLLRPNPLELYYSDSITRKKQLELFTRYAESYCALVDQLKVTLDEDVDLIEYINQATSYYLKTKKDELFLNSQLLFENNVNASSSYQNQIEK
jgi:hypothetical protein